MEEKTYQTPCGTIHYWTNVSHPDEITLVFLPGLTADHRLFDKQIQHFKEKQNVVVWDAPAHAASWPFRFDFDLFDKAKWLKLLLKSGTEGVATSDYGRNLMREMMLVYDGDQKRYAQIAGHGLRILAEAMEKNLPYALKCPALLICGTQDHAGSCIRYNKAWHRNTEIPLMWIKGAGHNSNTDKPEQVNSLIEELVANIL